MTDIPITRMVKCPILFEHEPCDLVTTKNCTTCPYRVRFLKDFVVCTWGEHIPEVNGDSETAITSHIMNRKPW